MAPLIDYNSLESADVEAPLVEKPVSPNPYLKATPRVKLLAGGLVVALAAVAGYAAGSAAAPSATTALAAADMAQTTKAWGVNFGTSFMASPPTTPTDMDKFAEAAAHYKIPRLKIWQVDAQRDLALDAIKTAYGSDPLHVMVLIPNKDIGSCAADPSYAAKFVSDMAKYPFVTSVTVGNELDKSENEALFAQLPQACANVKAAAGAKLQVTSAMSNAITQARNGNWDDVIIDTDKVGVIVQMMPHIDFFSFNPYPIFNYNDAGQPQPQWHDWVDGNSGKFTPDSMLASQLKNMRHALDDSTCSSDCSKKPLAITETGWASAGASEATFDLADRFLSYTVQDLVSGGWDTTYGVLLDQVYLFELFDESQKDGGGMEPHFGLLNEDTSPKGFAILN